jgi:BirA family transcriptional regulator, biotin operon repressor / biotin---[acetyl-CoA-carboxylase] ligase
LISNFKLTFFDTPVIHLKTVDSTNTYLKNQKNDLPILVLADYQTEGRGQYGKNWSSIAVENLLFSFQFFPQKTSIENAHLISHIVAIKITEVLNLQIGHKLVTIKWPNDIILNNKKIGGILIETSLEGTKIQNIIVGIGLNINQLKFDFELKNASSLRKEYPAILWDKNLILEELVARFESIIIEESLGLNQSEIIELFNQNLFKFKEKIKIKKDSEPITALNLGVNETGQWILKNIISLEEIKINSSREVEYLF